LVFEALTRIAIWSRRKASLLALPYQRAGPTAWADPSLVDYGDRHGCNHTPGYATINLLAPCLVLIRPFSAGAELGSVSVLSVGIARRNRKGFYVGGLNRWQSFLP
jgi:hypothetical protein